MQKSRFSLSISLLGTIGFAFMLVAPAASQTPDPKQPDAKPLPTLWIIGDSTVRNGTKDDGGNGQWGWGNPIAHYFDKTKINVQNKALGGTSSRTFLTQGLWGKVAAQIKPGDFLIMQFGHNDSSALNDNSRARGTIKGNGEETQDIENMLTKKKETVHTYGWYLRKFISDAQEKGAVEAIICSPIPRNRWTGGKVARDTTYAVWGAEAAKQMKMPFIPLNAIIAKHYDEMGEKKVTDELFPVKETVHTDWAGAVLNAECVIEGLKAEHSQLEKYLLAEAPKNLKNPSGKAR